MLTRSLFLFFLLFAGAFTLVWLAGFTKFFDRARLRRLLKITGIGVVALFLTMVAAALLINIDHYL